VNNEELSRLAWHKSSRSNGQNNCVETAVLPDGGRALRDTKDRGNGPVLFFTADEWTAFTEGVRLGEFD
jgi:hypothetical protein